MKYEKKESNSVFDDAIVCAYSSTNLTSAKGNNGYEHSSTHRAGLR